MPASGLRGGDTSELRLAAAVRLSLEFRAARRTDVDEFLAANAPLRELLEPMLAPEPSVEDEVDEVDAAATNAADAGAGLLPGVCLGEYRIEAALGRGGMGAVYVARHAQLGRQVALKVMATPLLLRERALWRFQREARLLAQLDHPGIVEVFDAGVAEGLPYYAMELVPGASLAAVLAALRRAGLATADGAVLAAAVAGAMPAEQPPAERAGTGAKGQPFAADHVRAMTELCAQVAEALACAHAAGVVHRDVKPGNVLVRRDGRALLSDFGIARQEGKATVTLAGEFVGTIHYVSPEQIRGDDVDHRSDVFSLGVTLYEALTLCKPFDGDTTLAVLEAIRRDEPADPRARNPAVPRPLAAVLARALEKEPERRYASAGAFAADLRAFLADEPVSATPPTRARRLWRWARREPWRAAAVGVAAGACVALAASWTAFTGELIAESDRTRKALDDVERLALGVRLDRAERDAGAFRVARAAAIPEMQAWLRGDGEPLAAQLASLRELLSSVRGRALPYSGADAALDRGSHPDAEALRLVSREITWTNDLLLREPDSPHAAERRQRVERLERTRAELDARAGTRRTWRFASAADQFLHDQTEALADRLTRFAESPDGTLARVRAQLAWAVESAHRCLVEGAAAWSAAATAIAGDPRYGGLRLAPQTDLLPLGRDPRSGLYEFVHLRSGEPGKEAPPRRPDGTLEPIDETGIVFVLLPGGTFRMGAQAGDAQAPNHDPQAGRNESPVHEVTLAPFFAGKFEVTQAQWRRLTGETPSYYRAGQRFGGHDVTARHPVENVPYATAEERLRDHGLCLPTEAQWEYACRGGTDTPFSFGRSRADAPRHANVADVSVRGQTNWQLDEDLDDGFVLHAPVGSFAPNPFGLHDVHGNVVEMCGDPMIFYTRPVREGDGRREPFYSDVTRFVARGGSFYTVLATARSADRSNNGDPGHRNSNLGFRAARPLED